MRIKTTTDIFCFSVQGCLASVLMRVNIVIDVVLAVTIVMAVFQVGHSEKLIVNNYCMTVYCMLLSGIHELLLFIQYCIHFKRKHNIYKSTTATVYTVGPHYRLYTLVHH